MRIAFVGKGGSGKSTLTVLFTQLLKQKKHPLLLIDADLNMHIPLLLGNQKEIPQEKHLSDPKVVKEIQEFLKNDNKRIKELAHFKKTTPPGSGSRLITLSEDNIVFQKYTTIINEIPIMIVGTYQEDGIGTACYHNNLSIFENILTHLKDSTNEILVADMVAGIDSFANTLHIQFDIILLVVEPTLRGLEVIKQFTELAHTADIQNNVYIVGNKVKNQKDREFLSKNIPPSKLLGFITHSEHIQKIDQEGGSLELNQLEQTNRHTLDVIYTKLTNTQPNHGIRQKKLHELHKKYVAQKSITDRLGDLTSQIDPEFAYE